MNEEEFSEKSDSKKELLGKIAIFCGFGFFGYLIAHNIYKACYWEIHSFFGAIFSGISDFFSTIIYGKRTYTTKIEVSWWIVIFCAACYLVGYSLLKSYFLISDLFERCEIRLKFFSGGKTRDQIAAQILADYASYEDFKMRFKDFDKLSENAKREVRKLFEVD